MPTTEFVVAPLQPGAEIGDPDNAGAKAIKECGDTLSKTDGVQQIHFGMQVENPSNFQMAVGKWSLSAFPLTDSLVRHVSQDSSANES